jgi:hypothetical protein
MSEHNLRALPKFLDSIHRLNRFKFGKTILEYQYEILATGCFKVCSPFTGQAIEAVDSLLVSGHAIAYRFECREVFWLITGDIQFGYPLATFLAEPNGVLLALLGDDCHYSATSEPAGHWLDTIHQRQGERNGGAVPVDRDHPAVLMGHSNFAHHVWNELSALAEWAAVGAPERTANLRILPTREPLGPVEDIIPDLRGAEIIRTAATPREINSVGGLLLHVGCRVVSARIQAHIAAFLSKRAEAGSGKAADGFMAGKWPIFWVSARVKDRTCTNQQEFLAALIRRLLSEYPAGAVLIDGFAFPEGREDAALQTLFEQRSAELDKVIGAVIDEIDTRCGKAFSSRIKNVSGTGLIENLHLAQYCHFYVCHAGTLQHKVGWIYNKPGVIHTCLEGGGRSTESWHADQVEQGRPPRFLPERFIEVVQDDERERKVPRRNRNYRITAPDEAVAWILEQARGHLLPKPESGTGRQQRTNPGGRKKNCTLYGNWQMQVIQRLLGSVPEFLRQYRFLPLEPAPRLHRSDVNRIADLASRTDLLITQPVPDNFKGIPELSTRYWLSRLPDGAAAVHIPSAQFAGYNPELFQFRREDGSHLPEPFDYHDRTLLEAWGNGMTREAAVEFLLSGGLADPLYYLRAWRQAVDSVRRSEAGLDVAIADLIESQGRGRRLFPVCNQPSPGLMALIAEAILGKVLGGEYRVGGADEGGFDDTCYPVHQNAADALGFEFENDPRLYRIKGQEKTVDDMVADCFRFYDRHKSLAESNLARLAAESREGMARFSDGGVPRLAGVQAAPPPIDTAAASHPSANGDIDLRRIHPRETTFFEAPQRLDDRSPPHPRLALKDGIWPETRVGRIPGGKAHLGSAFRFYDRHGNLVRELSDDAEDTPLADTGFVPIEGRVCPIIFRGSGIYAHWMGDVLPALHLVELAGIDLASIDRFIFLRKDQGYHRESCKRLGIDPKKILVFSRQLQNISADELIVPSQPRTHMCTSPWIADFLRRTFLPSFDAARAPAPGLRLYLSRAKAGKRRVANEADIAGLLARYGFRTVHLEDISVAAAAKLLSNAEMVVAAHGAGMANLVFCRPGTKIIELYSWHISQEYWMLAATLGLDYYCLACPEPGGRYYDEIELDYGTRFQEINTADIRVDSERLETALDTLLEPIPIMPAVGHEPALTENPFEEDDGGAGPVFIFSACWRTGSTLLQRILNASDDIMIWGEPGYLEHIRKTYELLARHQDAQKNMWENIGRIGFSRAWTPTLAPRDIYPARSMRSFFSDLYRESAKACKPHCTRWGFKEVRKNAVRNAAFLARIFPEAKFIFHLRHPFECFESILGGNLHKNFDDPLDAMIVYRDNLADFLALDELAAEGKAGFPYKLVKHEDITGPEGADVLGDLFDFIGVAMPGSVQGIVSGKKIGGSKDKQPLSPSLRLRVSELLEPLASRVGYRLS